MQDEAPSVIPTNIASILRILGGVLGGWLLSKGYFTNEQLAQIGGAALPLLAVVWAFIKNHNSKKALNDAIAAPTGQAK